MTLEQKYADDLAADYKAVEDGLRRLKARLNRWPATINVGPLNKEAIDGLVAGALGMVAQSHLNASRYDPRPTTFEGGDFDTIIESIDRRLFAALGADTIVMPGHGDDTTIATEAPHLQEWVDRGW